MYIVCKISNLSKFPTTILALSNIFHGRVAVSERFSTSASHQNAAIKMCTSRRMMVNIRPTISQVLASKI